jgi:RNA polymerase sigma-70 factor, ECF subfamily
MAMATTAVEDSYGVAKLRAVEDRAPDFDDLYERYHRRVRGFVRRKIADPHVVDDVVQEVFLRVYRSLDSVDPDRDPWPWLARVADNAAVDALRRRRPVEEMRDAIVDGLSASIRSGDDPAERFTAGQRREGIAKAMGALCDRQRRMLLLREAEGWRYEDIAEFEGITLNALKSALKRARQCFRDAYTAVADERGLWGAILAPVFIANRKVRDFMARGEAQLTAPLSGMAAGFTANMASLMVVAGIATASVTMAVATELPASVPASSSRPASASTPTAAGSGATDGSAVDAAASDATRRLAAVGMRSDTLTGDQPAGVAPGTELNADDDRVDVLATLGVEAPGTPEEPTSLNVGVNCDDERAAVVCDTVPSS